MGSRQAQNVTFDIEHVLQPIYTGGDATLDASGRILATCLREDALVTDLKTGMTLCRIEGDREILTALLITPSASHLITCSRSLLARVYSLRPRDDSNNFEATLTSTLRPHSTPVVTTAVDSTGTMFATGSSDGSVKIWDIRGGYATHTFRGHSGIISSLKFFELQSMPVPPALSKPGKRKKRGKSDPEGDMIMLDEGNRAEQEANANFRLASGGDDGKIRIWDLVKRKAVATLDSHVSVVRGLDFSSSQNALVSSSRDKTLIIWDARTWKTRRVVPVLEVLEDAVFTNHGRFICSGGENGHVRVWDADSGQEITKEQKPAGDSEAIVRLIHSPKGNLLLAVHADQTLILHQLETIQSLMGGSRLDSLPILRRISGTYDEVIDLAYVTPEQNLLALATNSDSVRLVTATTQNSPDSENIPYFGADVGLLQGHEDIIICLDTDWSGCWLATGAKDNNAKLWRIDHDARSYTCYATFTGHAESLGAIALPVSTPQRDSIAYKDPLSHPPAFIVTGSQDRTVKRWTVSAGKGEKKAPKAVYTRRAHDKDINAIAINHDSTLFASASQDKTVKIWSVDDGEVQGVLRGHKRGVWSVQFAPKDTPSILGDNSQTSSGRGVLLTGSGDTTVKIWSLSDYSCLRTFEGHANSVLKVIWLPPHSASTINAASDNESKTPFDQISISRPSLTLIASAGGDGLLKLWDAQTGEPAATLDNHTDRIWALTTHPRSRTLVSGGADSVITFWKDTTASTAAARARAAMARVEQEQELSNYVQRGNYQEAIVLALTLNHPGRLLALFTNIVKRNPPEEGSLSGLKAADEVVGSLSDDQLYNLLLRLRDWNTNARTAAVAQRILWVVVKSYSVNRLVALGKVKGCRGLRDVLEALKVYTERHYRRMEELLEESYIVDFVVRSMGKEGFVGERVEANRSWDHKADVLMMIE